MAAGLQHELAPALAEAMRAGVASSMREVLRAEHQSDIDRVATALTRATVDAMSRGMAEGLARDLIPSLRDALLDERTANALHAGTRELARQVVLGSNDAMTQLQRQQDRGAPPSFLGGVSSVTAGGVRILGLLAASAVALIVLLSAWVLRLTLRGRRLRSESAPLDQAVGGRCAAAPR